MAERQSGREDGRYDNSLLAIDILKIDNRSRITLTKEVKDILPFKPGDTIAIYQDRMNSDLILKVQSERARTALVKNKARQIIKELAPTNPVYYEKLRERLEKIIEEEESRRIQDASYFNKIREVYNEAVNAEKERQKLGFSTQFEFAVYGLLQSLKSDERASKDITNAIYTKVKEEAGIVGWKNKRSSEKRMSISIYDILSENIRKYPEDKTNELTAKIIELAKRDL